MGAGRWGSRNSGLPVPQTAVSIAFSCLYNLCFPQKCSFPTNLLSAKYSLHSTSGGIKHTETDNREHFGWDLSFCAQTTGIGTLAFQGQALFLFPTLLLFSSPTVAGGSWTHRSYSSMPSGDALKSGK